MEANPIEQHMRTALRMRVLRDVELDEARRWSAVFGRASDDGARAFLRRTIEPHVVRARKFNRQMVIAQRGIRSTLQRRDVLDLVRSNFGNVRTIERAPAIVDNLVAVILGSGRGARAAKDGRRLSPALSRRRARRRQASRLIAFLLSIGAGGSSSGCAAIGATPWSELSTGEKIVNVAVIVGVAAYAAHASGGDATYVSTGNARPEPCEGAACTANPSIPCIDGPTKFPPGCGQ